MKLVVFAIAIVLLLWLLFGRRGRRPPQPPPPPAPRPQALRAEDMVVCAHCGVHLPRSEAVTAGPLLYCSSAHRLAGPREPPVA